ncbi:Hypothetical_protein [Hexamita inflata]|uniref:Hypothetical_protein n=1 Tax=Hexamita inflata TaxID=28002 RepID=A0AA86TEK0_9EUKA|nr:Hypothetical protein HINF_LOCUS2911 [Hexamita inflata]
MIGKTDKSVRKKIQEGINYLINQNNLLVDDFRQKLNEIYTTKKHDLGRMKKYYKLTITQIQQLDQAYQFKYKKQKGGVIKSICRDEYTKMYKQALQICLLTDFSDASIQQVCKTINSLSKQQRNIFWTNVGQQIFSNYQQLKTNHNIKKYYDNIYQQYAYSPLQQSDLQQIKQFVQNNINLTTSEMVMLLMTNQFKCKDVYCNQIRRTVNSFKKQQSENTMFPNRKTNTFQSTYKYLSQHTKMFSNQSSIQKVPCIKTQYCLETQQHYSDIFQEALKSSLNIQNSNSGFQICNTITNLNKLQSQTFWSYLKQTQKTAFIKLKAYYKASFQSVLFSDHLNESDKTFIRNQLDQDQTSSITDITQSLMQNYFKDRDIFYYEIYRHVFSQSKVQRCTKRESNISYTKYYTEIYRQGLSHVLEQDIDINIEPEEIIRQIDLLDRKQSKQFWKFLESNVVPHKTSIQLRDYFNIRYRKMQSCSQLSIVDKTYIDKFCQSHNELDNNQKVIQLSESYFKDKNKSKQQIHLYIDQHQQNIYNTNPSNPLAKLNKYTKFYNEALNALFQQPKDQSPKAICETINSLNQQQSLQFWNYLETIVKPQLNVELLKQYYNNSYQAVLYSGRLTAEDKQSIQQFCEQNKELTKKQQTKQLLETQYKDRDIFYWEMYRCISNYETLNKQKTQQNK